jgi:serine/threonine protein kinase
MLRFKAKFVKEAQTIATLNHGNIIPIYDVFEENNTAYYVMEYIEGESLSARVKRCGAMDECAAVAYIKQVASALEHIHHQQIMHLDVKPGNIMVRMRDDQAILIDFGLSKHYDVESGDATSTALVGVSHGFAPIEQYKQGGVNRFSPETDIYSFGATLYYLVTGSVPPQAADIADDGLPPLPSYLSSGVRKVIERSMADKRKDRPHTIKEFLTLMEEVKTATTAPSLGDEKTRIISPNAEPERTILPMSEEMQREMPRDTQREKSRDIIDFLLNFKWILLVFVAIAAIFMLRFVFAFSFMFTIIFMMFVVCAIFLAGIVYFKYLRKRK